jgi:hypothetical protein
MYSEWVSLNHDLRADKGNKSVLGSFPRTVGRDIAHTVVKTLIHDQGLPDKSKLSSSSEVDWVMEVFCYGLSLPMTEVDGEIIKGCVNVYIEWLTVLLSEDQSKTVPEPLTKEPVKYVQKIFQHLKNLFLIRVDDGSNLALQASLCIRVLQFFKGIANESQLSSEIWDALLRLMLVINEQLLSPPYTPGGLCEHLKEILVNSLLEVWLHACIQYFPPPSMWKTLQELCMSWRHHNAMIEYWSSTSLMLTRKVIKYLYGNSFPLPSLKSKKNEVHIPPVISRETLLQTWFRILHIISNPVDLCNRKVISDTPKFKEFALSCQDVTFPSAHPCLDGLPQIFLHAMKGIAVMVNTFLGITTSHDQPVMHTPIIAPIKGSSPSASKKREIKTLSTGLALGLGENRSIGIRSLTMPSRHSSGTSMTGIPTHDDEMLGDEKESHTPASSLFSKSPKSPSATTAPSVDSLLDLYGAWLFEAAFAKLDMKSSYDAIGDIYDKCCETIENSTGTINSPRKIRYKCTCTCINKCTVQYKILLSFAV